MLGVLTVWSYASWTATPFSERRGSTPMVLAVLLLGLFMNAAVPGALGDSG